MKYLIAVTVAASVMASAAAIAGPQTDLRLRDATPQQTASSQLQSYLPVEYHHHRHWHHRHWRRHHHWHHHY